MGPPNLYRLALKLSISHAARYFEDEPVHVLATACRDLDASLAVSARRTWLRYCLCLNASLL